MNETTNLERAIYERFLKQHGALREVARRRRGEIVRLRRALEWYASPRTWNQWLPDSAGDRAREALNSKPPDPSNG